MQRSSIVPLLAGTVLLVAGGLFVLRSVDSGAAQAAHKPANLTSSARSPRHGDPTLADARRSRPAETWQESAAAQHQDLPRHSLDESVRPRSSLRATLDAARMKAVARQQAAQADSTSLPASMVVMEDSKYLPAARQAQVEELAKEHADPSDPEQAAWKARGLDPARLNDIKFRARFGKRAFLEHHAAAEQVK